MAEKKSKIEETAEVAQINDYPKTREALRLRNTTHLAQIVAKEEPPQPLIDVMFGDNRTRAKNRVTGKLVPLILAKEAKDAILSLTEMTELGKVTKYYVLGKGVKYLEAREAYALINKYALQPRPHNGKRMIMLLVAGDYKSRQKIKQESLCPTFIDPLSPSEGLRMAQEALSKGVE